MNYEKKYKDALEWARKVMQGKVGFVLDEVLEKFPELKESEDERIKEDIIIYLSTVEDKELIPYETWIAWLEKQGEQKQDVNMQIEPSEYINDMGGNGCYLKNDTQKPADKVEPKFHEGEWITNGDYTWKIVEVKPLDYILQSQDGNVVDDTISHIDEQFHSFTIQDAKAGDVLAFYSEYKGNKMVQVGIIEKYVGKHGGCSNAFKIYVGVNWDNNLQIGDYMGCSDIRPATKEQRDTLIKAMTDAGYTFDFEKKELKKIEHKPAMIQWKGNNLKEVIDFTGIYKDGFEKWFHNSWEEYEKYVHEHNNIFKIFNKDGSHIEVPVGAWIVKTPDGYNTASRYVFKQKPTWSKEDERRLNTICGLLEDIPSHQNWLRTLKDRVLMTKVTYDERDKEKLESIINKASYNCCLKNDDISFLKSLKDRYTWKPSEEEMVALEHAINCYSGISPTNTNEVFILEIMKERLKNLTK